MSLTILLYILAALAALAGAVCYFRPCLFEQARPVSFGLFVLAILLVLGALGYQGVTAIQAAALAQPTDTAATVVDATHLNEALAQNPGVPSPVINNQPPASTSVSPLASVSVFANRFNTAASQAQTAYKVPSLVDQGPAFQVNFMKNTTLTGKKDDKGIIQELHYSSTVQTVNEAVDAGKIMALVVWGADATLEPPDYMNVLQNMLNPNGSIRSEADFIHGKVHYQLHFAGATVTLAITAVE